MLLFLFRKIFHPRSGRYRFDDQRSELRRLVTRKRFYPERKCRRFDDAPAVEPESERCTVLRDGGGERHGERPRHEHDVVRTTLEESLQSPPERLGLEIDVGGEHAGRRFAASRLETDDESTHRMHRPLEHELLPFAHRHLTRRISTSRAGTWG